MEIKTVNHGWWTLFSEASSIAHCIPAGDLRPHAALKACWCRPTETEPGVYLHHSLDRREQYENHELRYH